MERLVQFPDVITASVGRVGLVFINYSYAVLGAVVILATRAE